MPDVIQHKRNGSTGVTPTNGELVLGELAVNYYDGRLFIETYDGTTYGIAQFQPMADGDKGDITVSAKGQTWTIDNDAVTYAKIQNVSATDRLLGRSTAGAGDIEEITCTAAGRAILDDADAAAQRTTLGLGTIATQDASSVAITGGTINGATVGATTAASGRFTTITGTSTTASTSSTTGALIVAGGAGIANDIWVNDIRCGRGNTGVVHNTVLGRDAGRVLNGSSNGNCLIGYQTGYFVTSGQFNMGMGKDALASLTSGLGNMAIGSRAVYSTSTNNHNVGVGTEALFSATGGLNVGIGGFAGSNLAGVSYNTCIGYEAGRYHSNGSTALTGASSSTYLGARCRGNNNSDSNSIVIGADAIGDGANTTVLGTSSTTQTKLHGTATSVGIISGDRLRIANAKTPATSGAAGTAGDICWDADYLYVCIAANTWRRVAHATF